MRSRKTVGPAGLIVASALLIAGLFTSTAATPQSHSAPPPPPAIVTQPAAASPSPDGSAPLAEQPELHVTTEERLETEAWWPTMASAPLSSYTGSAACLRCHSDMGSAAPTGMQLAAARGKDSRFLPGSALLAFLSGSLTYTLAPNADGTQYSVSNGEGKATENLAWVVGAGDLARTFLYSTEGRWFQSEVSYYTHPASMDITTGFGPSTSQIPSHALGNALTPAEARACFGCHTVHAVTPAGVDPAHAEAGIGCEACHGPGAGHAAAMKAGAPSNASAHASAGEALHIFSPANLSSADSIDFCGSCHRTFADASLSTGPSAGRAVVRFQPYRLEESKCWRVTQDERLTCVACHNPHQPLQRTTASYERTCLQCHAPAAKLVVQHVASVCPKATHDCVTCHMPKVEVGSMHGSFTDHYIRVVREGEPLPR